MRLSKLGNNISLIVLGLSGLAIFVVDRFFKYQAVHDWSGVWANKYLGWYPYFNRGIGFGLPVPSAATISLTMIILFLIVFLFYKQVLSNGIRYKVLGISSLLLIFVGALSNLIDRIFFGYVVDYFFVLTGYINLADIMIVSGFIIYIIKVSKRENIKTV